MNLLVHVLAACLLAAASHAAGTQDPPRRRMPPLPVVEVLDADGDGVLSAAEIADAPRAIAKLDRDGDGEIDESELTPPRPGGRERRGRGPGGPGMMARMVPAVAALDVDLDGALSDEEIAEAADSLATLDEDGDGELARDEWMPSFGPGGPGGPGRFGRRGRGEALAPAAVDPHDGAAELPDRAAFDAFSYQGREVAIDTQLTGLQFVKFTIDDAWSDAPRLYFINTETHRAHPAFASAVGLSPMSREQMKGVLVHRPLLAAADGTPGAYTFEFEPFDAYDYESIRIAFDLLNAHAPILRGRLAYYPLPRAIARYEEDRAKYEDGGIPVVVERDLFADIAFLPMHEAESFGTLRLLAPGERPGPRDIVLYRSLPNELPRVAGMITGARQTPLSHVNLRAVQDGVPNAYVRGAADDPAIAALLGRCVYYRVTARGYELRAATAEELDAHFGALRPPQPQTPPRDLSVTEIRPLGELGFGDSAAFGVKAANLAAMRRMGLPAGVVPDGFAIPFHFYDAFMTHHGLYERAGRAMAGADFARDAEVRTRELAALRTAIERAELPAPLAAALAELQRAFPAGTRIRCRSSTNNEDLPGFSGAGLYDSFTHAPDEGHLGETVKQVWASLWNLRAFEEREFFRVDHLAAAMGVLVHPSYAGEAANGVAVTQDVAYQTDAQVGRSYYVNVQVGEDLVTNPAAESVPEELLLAPTGRRPDRLVQASSRVAPGEHFLGDAQRETLRQCLRTLHREFRRLYGKKLRDRFAIEVEFKVTAAGDLAIKQARPWVF